MQVPVRITLKSSFRLLWVIFGVQLGFSSLFSGNFSKAELRPVSKIRFFDPCDQKETFIQSGHKIGVQVEIEKVEISKPVSLEVVLKPTGVHSDSTDKSTVRIRKNLKPDKNGKLVFKQNVKLRDTLSPVLEPEHIWNAKLIWHQKETPFGGGSMGAIRLVHQKIDRLYQIQGPMICSWETPVGLDSEFYFNADQDVMEVSRDFSSQQGVSNGPEQDMELWDRVLDGHFMQMPIFGHIQENLPWFFYLKSNGHFHRPTQLVTQTWKLAKGEGGYFGRRLSFERFRAFELRKEKVKGCSKWIPGRMGYLDSGKNTVEFDLIPADVGQDVGYDPDRIQELMELRRSAINTCDSKTFGKLRSQFRIPVDRMGLQFFYPDEQIDEIVGTEVRFPEEVVN